jgi:hypothetical protein
MVLFAGLAALGCASTKGTLAVDGAPFTPVRCRRAERQRLLGVELVDGSGKKLVASLGRNRWKVSYPTAPFSGAPTVTVFTPDGRSPGSIVACGTMTIVEEKSTAWYRLVDGSMDLACAAGEHSVAGHLEYSSCH